jgi:hypothetical protein
MNFNSDSTQLVYSHGLWLGAVASRYGAIELVLDGTAESPSKQQLAAIQEFMPRADETITHLCSRLPLSFLWRPVRLAPNDQGRVGVQFQHRLLNRRQLLFLDEQR